MSLEPSWTGRAALMTATGGHPYARYTGGDDTRGYQRDSTVVWAVGPAAWGIGDPLHAAKVGTGIAGLNRIDLPRVDEDATAHLLPVARQRDWQFRWTFSAPPQRTGETRVVPLGPTHHDGISRVLDDVLSYTGNRPGDPRLRAWYGIFDGEHLAAVGGDRSRHGVGYLAPIAVAARHQGRGYGAALTAALTRALLSEFGVCALGIVEHNLKAKDFFNLMGYQESLHRSAIDLHTRQ
ncbi:MAG TPA: GNAT family N-acetyltransferase [Candidatus Limnocylindrales bacterium]